MFEHDFNAYPELTNTELETLRFTSPHPQIVDDFYAQVVKIHDGDTVTLKTDFRDFDFPMRFLEINAPELSEEGGKESGEWLSQQLLNKDVIIQINPTNRVEKYGRLLGSIMVNGVDIAQVSINLGHAKPFQMRNEGKIPSANATFDIKKWL